MKMSSLLMTVALCASAQTHSWNSTVLHNANGYGHNETEVRTAGVATLPMPPLASYEGAGEELSYDPPDSDEIVGDRAIFLDDDGRGWKYFYEGPPGTEHLVRAEDAESGLKKFYEGEWGWERLVRTEDAESGLKDFFEGPPGTEHLVRTEDAESGLKKFYEGEWGRERLVRAEDAASGLKDFYEGPPGTEHLVRTEYAESGLKKFYEGAVDTERLVQVGYANGRTEFNEGPPGKERLVQQEGPGPSVDHTKALQRPLDQSTVKPRPLRPLKYYRPVVDKTFATLRGPQEAAPHAPRRPRRSSRGKVQRDGATVRVVVNDYTSGFGVAFVLMVMFFVIMVHTLYTKEQRVTAVVAEPLQV